MREDPSPFIQPLEVTRQSESHNERNKLGQILHSVGLPLNRANVTLPVLLSCLKKSKKPFSTNTVSRVFSLAAQNDEISIRVFVEEYLRRKREVTNILETAYRDLASVEQTLIDSDNQLRCISADEVTYGPRVEESKLTAQVVSVQHLPDGDISKLYKVFLTCQHQAIETRPVHVGSGVAFFNEMFSFQLASAEGDLKISLIEIDSSAMTETVVGEASIMVADLADQRRHELSKQLFDLPNVEAILTTQWVYNKRSLHQSYLNEFTGRKTALLNDISAYRNEFEELNRIFGDQEETTLGQLAANGPAYVAEAIDRTMAGFKISNSQLAGDYVITITLVILCITSFGRCVFWDLGMAGLTFWCNLEPRRWSTERYSFLMASNAISAVFDFCWMNIYFFAWSIRSTESDIQSIAKISSFFLFLWKIVIITFFWKSRYELRKKEAQDYQLNHILTLSQQAQMHEQLYEQDSRTNVF